MFSILNSYLFQHRNISVPGLGTIYLERLPSSIDPDGGHLFPPVYYFRFDKYFDAPDKDFFNHLAVEKNIPDYEAMKLYNEFSFELRNKIRQEEKVEWEGVGILRKDAEGNIVFESTSGTPSFLLPIPAEKIVKETPADPLPVINSAEEEASNISTDELLYQDQELESKRSWWLYPAIAAAVAVILLLYHFSSNGWKFESLSNQNQLQVSK